MNQHAAFLNEVREDRSDLARVLQKHKGIRRTVEDLYPDNAHFIYELLQNAEDKGATKASFTLKEDRLIFEHNGESFSAEDVWGITDIGEGTKATDKEKIGCFGIGFKAVFAYTDSPEIYSPTYSFRIDQLVLPSELPSDSSVGETTRFVFPFNSSKKSPQVAFDEIQKRLDELSELTLLFLSCLNEIRWGSTIVRRIQHSETYYEVRKEVSNKVVEGSHFLRFSELVAGLNKQYVRLAYPLQFIRDATSFDPKKPLHSQMQIVGAEAGIVAVSFPCSKEASGLRFHLHAPFVPELSRASVKETVANEPLFEQLARLSASSLHVIRDLRLLTADFLGVLPNSKESLPERYHIFRDAIISEMNSEALTPTFKKSHSPALKLLQSRASLKSFLTEDDIRFVLELDDNVSYEWAVSASQKNSLQDHFLDSLDIRDWSTDEFVKFLKTNATRNSWREPSESYLEWLNGKTDDWMQALYAALYTEFEPAGAFDQFKSLAIVRQDAGILGTGGESYFPSDGVRHDGTLPRVAEGVYKSGNSKKQQEAARKFLEHLGVREVGETEEIEAILKLRYNRTNIEPRKSDFKRFVTLVETEPKKATLFKDYFIFECEGGDWVKPSDIYIDSPFRDTGLSSYYEALGENARRFPLASSYTKIGIGKERIAKFAESVGAQIKLFPVQSSCKYNPEWLSNLKFASGERWSEYSLDIDFQIPQLAILLVAPNVELSRLLWNTMSSLKPTHLQAEYRINRSGGSRKSKSHLAHMLTTGCWVPQKHEGSIRFVAPLNAAVDLLPDGFPYDGGQKWFGTIEFGEGEQKRESQRDAQSRKQRELAAQLGITADAVNRMSEREQDKRNFIATLNESVAGSSRRSQKLADRSAASGRRQYLSRMRQVRVGRVPSDEVFQYLSTFYLIEDRWHCQMCCESMPFQMRDGSDCHEKREMFNGAWAKSKGLVVKSGSGQGAKSGNLPECIELYLLLCPLCHSFFHEYVFQVTDEQESLFNWISDWNENETAYTISCSRHTKSSEPDRKLQFHRKHLGDIRSVLGTSACVQSEET